MKVCPKCGHHNPPEIDRCDECGTSLSAASAEEKDPFLDTLVVGKFLIKELIGQGAMGRVYRAIQQPIHREVAIKVLHKHLMEDPRIARRFQREAEAASRFNHPNSIQIFDFGPTETGSLYIAMEFITGIDLAKLIGDESPLPYERSIRIATQVLAALQLAHQNKIIHRDLKPENIMLASNFGQKDFVKVCDFGIAKIQQPSGMTAESALTMFGMICGTPYYMSPEQAKGEELDGRTDLYSLGVILYEMLTGKVPFYGATPVEVIARHLTDEPEPPSVKQPDIPKAIEDVILRALKKQRDLRFADAHEFSEHLERALKDSLYHAELEQRFTLDESSHTGSLPGFSRPLPTSIPVAQGIAIATSSSSLAPSPSSLAIAPGVAVATASPAKSLPVATASLGQLTQGRRPTQQTPSPMPAASPSLISGPRASQESHVSTPRVAISSPPPPSILSSANALPISVSAPPPPPPQALPKLPPPKTALSVSPSPPNFDDLDAATLSRKGKGAWFFLFLIVLGAALGGYYFYLQQTAESDPSTPNPDPLPDRPPPRRPLTPSAVPPPTERPLLDASEDPDDADSPEPTPPEPSQKRTLRGSRPRHPDPSLLCSEIEREQAKISRWLQKKQIEIKDLGALSKTYYSLLESITAKQCERGKPLLGKLLPPMNHLRTLPKFIAEAKYNRLLTRFQRLPQREEINNGLEKAVELFTSGRYEELNHHLNALARRYR